MIGPEVASGVHQHIERWQHRVTFLLSRIDAATCKSSPALHIGR